MTHLLPLFSLMVVCFSLIHLAIVSGQTFVAAVVDQGGDSSQNLRSGQSLSRRPATGLGWRKRRRRLFVEVNSGLAVEIRVINDTFAIAPPSRQREVAQIVSRLRSNLLFPKIERWIDITTEQK